MPTSAVSHPASEADIKQRREIKGGSVVFVDQAPVRAAMQHAGLPFTLLEYQPLYRSMAGTGSGMGFGYWM